MIKKVMETYPIFLNNLAQQRVVVVGGGRVALRKVKGLLAAGASVVLISPEIDPKLVALSQQDETVQLEKRCYQRGDLQGSFLVVAATDDPAVNEGVWEEAKQERCLINVVDDPDHCNFIIPAVVKRGEFSIAISTGGSSPALARRVRERLEKEFGKEYADLTALLGELRPTLLASFPPGEARVNAALKLIDSNLIDILKHDGYSQAKKHALAIIDSASSNGQ